MASVSFDTSTTVSVAGSSNFDTRTRVTAISHALFDTKVSVTGVTSSKFDTATIVSFVGSTTHDTKTTVSYGTSSIFDTKVTVVDAYNLPTRVDYHGFDFSGKKLPLRYRSGETENPSISVSMTEDDDRWKDMRDDEVFVCVEEISPKYIDNVDPSNPASPFRVVYAYDLASDASFYFQYIGSFEKNGKTVFCWRSAGITLRANDMIVFETSIPCPDDGSGEDPGEGSN